MLSRIFNECCGAPKRGVSVDELIEHGNFDRVAIRPEGAYQREQRDLRTAIAISNAREQGDGETSGGRYDPAPVGIDVRGGGEAIIPPRPPTTRRTTQPAPRRTGATRPAPQTIRVGRRG